MMKIQDECEEIAKILGKIPKKITGKDAVSWLKENSNQWKQMEWPGWFFEEFLFRTLKKKQGGDKGPVFGKTTLDYKNNFVWDFKSHSQFNKQNKPVSWTVMNDKEAIESCISDFGGVGFIIAEFFPVFDYDGEFKKWHDNLKGKKSKYVEKKEREKASSRMRKKEIIFKKILFIYFNSVKDIERGYEGGWLANFQEGMKNSNDNPRRVKIQCDIRKIPREFIIKELVF